jgi:hypothetical protein
LRQIRAAASLNLASLNALEKADRLGRADDRDPTLGGSGGPANVNVSLSLIAR